MGRTCVRGGAEKREGEEGEGEGLNCRSIGRFTWEGLDQGPGRGWIRDSGGVESEEGGAAMVFAMAMAMAAVGAGGVRGVQRPPQGGPTPAGAPPGRPSVAAFGKAAKDRGVQAYVVGTTEQGGTGRALDGERLLLEFKKAVSRAGHMRELRHRRTFENSVDERKRRARGRSLRRKAEERQRKMFQDSWRESPPSHIPLQERTDGRGGVPRYSPPAERGAGPGPSWNAGGVGEGARAAAAEAPAVSSPEAAQAGAAAAASAEAASAAGASTSEKEVTSNPISASALAALEDRERLAIAKAKRNTAGQRKGGNAPRRATSG